MKFLKAISICLLFFVSNVSFALMVGFSQRDITPTRNKVTLGGYGTYFISAKTTRRSKGIHDPLKASTTVFYDNRSGEYISLTSIDAIGLSPAITKRISEGVNSLTSKNVKVLISATHTHSAPDVVGLWGALPHTGRSKTYMRHMESQIIASIVDAMNAIEEVSVSVSKSILENVSSGQEITKEVNTLWFKNKNAEVVGTITQWNAHPVMLGHKNNFVSAGFVGTYRKLMSNKFDAVHVYLNGLLGNVFPKDFGSNFKDPFVEEGKTIYDEDVDVNDYLKMVGVGSKLFDSVISGYEDAKTVSVNAAEVSEFKFSGRNKNILFKAGLKLDVLEGRDHKKRYIKSSLFELKLGEVSYLFVPGEIMPEAFLELQNLRPESKFFPVGIANDWIGYILNEEQTDDDDYDYFKLLSTSDDILEDMKEGFKQ